MGSKIERMIQSKVTDTQPDPNFFTAYGLGVFSGAIYNGANYSKRNVLRGLILLTAALVHYVVQVVFFNSTLEALDVVELVHFIMLYVTSFTTNLCFLMSSERMKSFCILLEEQVNNPIIKLSEQQLKIREKSNVLIISLFKFAGITFNLALLGTFIRKPSTDLLGEFNFTLPYNGWLPFVVDTWIEYLGVVVFQAIISTYVVFGLFVLFVLLITHTSILSSELEMLAVLIKESFESNKIAFTRAGSAATRKAYIDSRMRYIVSRHQLLIRVFKELSQLYSPVLLILSANAGIFFCTAIFISTDPNGSIYMTLVYMIVLMPELAYFGMYCWFGQQIMDKWNMIRDSLYELEWFTESLRTQKAILMMLSVSAKDKVLRGGALTQYSMKGYAELIQTGFSSYNMLKAVR